MNSMMLYPTYDTLFLKNFHLSYCRIKYSAHLKSTSVLTDNADPDIHFFNDPLQGDLFKNSDY